MGLLWWQHLLLCIISAGVQTLMPFLRNKVEVALLYIQYICPSVFADSSLHIFRKTMAVF